MSNGLNIPSDKILILFDGVCNLCNNSVLLVIKNDKANKFLFAPIESTIGELVISEFDIDTDSIDSIITYNPAKHEVKFKASAALFTASQMQFPYPLMRVFYIVPPFIRNWIYDIVAQNRYKWFGKKDRCVYTMNTYENRFI